MQPVPNRSMLMIPLTATLLLASASQAVVTLTNGQSVNLGALMAGNDRRVRIDDKLFTFESFTSSQYNANNFSLIAFVSANTNQFGLHNVGFDLTGPFGDGLPGDGLSHEMNLQYQVAVRQEFYDRGVRLCDTRLAFNGSAGGTGAYARVDETVWDLDANRFLGNLSAYANSGPPPEQRFTDEKNFCQLWNQPDGFRAFEVNKDIKFLAPSRSDFAAASFVRQEFSQIMAMPTPGALALVAVSALVGTRRRR